jgi:integrative and conjugative element protein (TIGR02256 family)
MMTRGQEIALEQLRDIEAAAEGSIELLRTLPQLDKLSDLRVELSIECEAILKTSEGLPLRSRERFQIDVPPDFPFAVPSVNLRHVRFAGFPHVQWGSHLCLYQSPATEWDPSDGMFGFIGRLVHWLRRGAINEFEAPGEPLHPPAVYSRATEPLFIARADTPSVEVSTWFGLAELRDVSSKRIDIVGWSELFAERRSEHSAAAILLPVSLPWEFPTDGKTLLRLLDEQGIHRKLLLLTLAVAAHGGREGDPLYILVGARMRGVRGSDDLRQHLTVWKLDATSANRLRLSLPRTDDTQELRGLRDEIQELTGDIIELSTVQWCPLREDRPEIVTRRDRGAPVSWFRGKTIAIWGCGALGGAVAEALARADVARLILRDSGIVAPGLLARQPYDDSDIGHAKAEALARRLQRIRPHGLDLVPKVANLLQEPLGADDWTEGADLIIDASTSEAVLEKLELRRRREPRVPVVSMVIGHRAEQGFVVLAGRSYSGGPKDVTRRAKLAACSRDELQHWANEFWPGPQRRAPFQPEPGCSEATFVGSWADVSVLAASMLNMVACDLATIGADLATAHFLAQACVPLLRSDTRQVSFSWRPDVILEDPHSGYEIRIAPAAWRDIRGWVENSRRCSGPLVETGGVLFGERNDASEILWVSEVLGAPKDSKAGQETFVCGIDGVSLSNNEKRARTRGSVAFVGLWHTHPVSAPVPSPTDFEGAAQMLMAKEPSTPKVLLLIIGRTAAQEPWEAGAYLIARRDFDLFRFGKTMVRQAHYRQISTAESDSTIGLALSGGGSRAIAFHLGCLRALHDLGILRNVRVISAVSGGAVITGAFAYCDDDFAGFERRIEDILRRGLAGGIARRTFFSTNTPRALATVVVAGGAALGAWVLRGIFSLAGRLAGKEVLGSVDWTARIQAPLRRWFTRTHALEATLRDYLLGTKKLGDARRDDIDVVFNACELRTGTAFRFGSRESGNWRLHKVKGNDVDVAHAIAASAAYPAMLPAFDEMMTFTRPDGTETHERVVLTDGGVFENLGVSCLEPGRSKDFGYNTYKPDYIISCDAGAGQFSGHDVPYGWISRMSRSFETVFRKAHDATLQRLHSYVPSGQLKGFVLAYLGQQDKSFAVIPSAFVKREEVMAYPTDFSAMSGDMIKRLSLRGEQLVRMLVSRYWSDL